MNLAPSSKKKGGKMSAAEIQLEQQRKMRLEAEQEQNARTLEAKSSQAPMIHVKAKLGRRHESVASYQQRSDIERFGDDVDEQVSRRRAVHNQVYGRER